MTSRAGRLASFVVPPLVFGVVFVAAWEAFVVFRDVQPFVLPKPSSIWSAALDNVQSMWDASKVSGGNALAGLIIGTVLGCLVAAAANRFRWLSDLVSPGAIAVNAIPIVVLVAIFSKMYEQTSEVPRRLVAVLLVFFIVFVNVVRGLRHSNPTQLELMRSYAASPRQQFWKVRLPNATPFLFTGIRIAAPAAVITAVVAEYFGGNQNGLGSKITGAMASSRKDVGLAYVGAACLLGIAFFAAAAVLEYVAVPWQRHRASK